MTFADLARLAVDALERAAEEAEAGHYDEARAWAAVSLAATAIRTSAPPSVHAPKEQP